MGATMTTPHIWAITFATTSCPPRLEGKRRMMIKYGNVFESIPVHHPRSSRRYPCSACLSTYHHRRECKDKNPDLLAKKFTLEVTMQRVEAREPPDP